jgi:D-cysteine desulfhydrase family pyridoxal phosphate-dependent enzyme
MKEPVRFPLAHLPTPLEPMHRLSDTLGGPELWIKRDDQTGLATGGNKTRKLECLIAHALARKADLVLTVGAAQSNHCRQTAAAAARAGLECVVVLRGEPLPREHWNGNLLLDDLLGARVKWAGDEEPLAVMEATADAERAAGRNAYTIPFGGSNAVGASGYALAFRELADQVAGAGMPQFDRVVFASASGGTQAGLVVGAKACGYEGQVLGISVHRTSDHLRALVTALLEPTAAYLDLDLFLGPEDVEVDDGYIGAGYGVLTESVRDAVREVAAVEGILLDPVYAGKAMSGLLDLVRRGEIGSGERVVFWHTGGVPALFAYAQGLLGA